VLDEEDLQQGPYHHPADDAGILNRSPNLAPAPTTSMPGSEGSLQVAEELFSGMHVAVAAWFISMLPLSIGPSSLFGSSSRSTPEERR